MAAFQQAGEIEPERLAQFLASWFEDGMITGVSLKRLSRDLVQTGKAL